MLGCYPVDPSKQVVRKPLGFRVFSCLCNCCCAEFIKKHCVNDWLLGTWIIFWGTLFATIGFVLYSLYGIYDNYNHILLFQDWTATLDCLFFLIGSAYFVAGSYPSDDEGEGGQQVQDVVVQTTVNNVINAGQNYA